MTTPAAVLVAVGLLASEFPTAAPIPASKPKADGLIAVICGDHLRLLNEAGREIKRYTPPIADGWPAWQIGPVSPDGSRVLLSATLHDTWPRYTRAVIASLDGKKALQRIPLRSREFGAVPFWSSDGKKLIDSHHVFDGAFGVSSHALNLAIDVATGRPVVLPLPSIEGGTPEGGVARFGLMATPGTYRRSLHSVLACSPTGGWYLTRQQVGTGWGVGSRTALVSRDGKTVRRIFDVACRVTSPVFSPDGKRVLLASWSLNALDGGWSLFDGVFVADVKDAAVRQVIAPPSDFVRIGICRVAWSPDGKRIAFGYHRKTGDDDQFEFRVVSCTPDGKDPRTVYSLTGTKKEVACLCLEGWR